MHSENDFEEAGNGFQYASLVKWEMIFILCVAASYWSTILDGQYHLYHTSSRSILMDLMVDVKYNGF